MTSAATIATILIVDDSSLCRDMISKSLHAEGMGTVAAVDGFDGLARLGRQRIDAIILDNEMPRMGGVAFLKALRSDKRWRNLPVLMLTATVAKEVVVEATQYGVNGYLLKTKMSMPGMIARVRQLLGSASTPAPKPKPPSLESLTIPNLLGRDATLEAVSQISGARTLPGVVSQIISIANTPRASMSDIAAVVKQDPVLCVRIVQLAGSAAYTGTKARLGNIEDAVRTVGISVVRDLAVPMPVFQVFPINGADGVDLLRCRQHSLAVASIMERIVPKSDDIAPGLPYLIGLCHNLAEILLRQRFPAEFSTAMDFARQAKLPPTDLVRQVFGIPYEELVETLFDRLKLPEAITGPINEYEFHSRSTADAHASVLARALAIANFLAHSILCTCSAENLIAPIPQIDCHTALIPTSAINLAEIRAESIMATVFLADAGPDLEAALLKPLLARNDLKVWYVRHPSFAALDPVEAALRSLCTVEMRDRMPRVEELADINGFVFASPGSVSALCEASRMCVQSGKSRPILNIVRTESDHSRNTIPDVEDVQYPIPLSRLMTFISSLGP